METRIASYQEPGIRLQLLKIEKEDIGTDGMPTSLGVTYYQIRKNRKVLCNFKWEGPARTRLATLIVQELQQLNIFSKYEEEKQRYYDGVESIHTPTRNHEL